MDRWGYPFMYDEKIADAEDKEPLTWAEADATWNEFSLGCLHELAWRHDLEWDDIEDADAAYTRIKKVAAFIRYRGARGGGGMNYYDYIEQRKAAAREHFKDHKATVVQKDDKFFILDWRHISGTSNYYVRYILDIKRGAFIISGDLGDCIACWYNEVNPENLARYISDIPYFMGKFQCASDKYTYLSDDIETDLDAVKQEYLDAPDWYNLREEIEEDFEEMLEILEDLGLNENTCYPNDLTDLMEKYDTEWWESAFTNIGRRIHPRVILWAVGYQMAVQQISEEGGNHGRD